MGQSEGVSVSEFPRSRAYGFCGGVREVWKQGGKGRSKEER